MSMFIKYRKITLFIKDLNEKQILLILLGIAFGLRLYAVLMAKGISYDGAAYGFVARDFLRHDFAKGLSSALHPLYPFLIYLLSPGPDHVEIVGRLISLFFGTITFIPVFYLAKEIAGQKGAILSGLFYSIHPYLVTYSGSLLSEVTYWGLFTLSVYFFWTGLKRKKVLRSIASGFFLALTYLTRPEGIGYLFIFVMWLFFYGGFKAGWFKKILLFGGVILPFLIFSILYMIRIHQETGQWLISKKAVGVQAELLRGGEQIDGSIVKVVRLGQKSEVQHIIKGVAKNVIQNIPFTAYHYLRAYHFALWLFLIFGLIRVRQAGGKLELFLASIVLFHLFSLSIFTGSTIRFSVPLIPISLFWAGAGVLEIQRRLQRVKISNPEKWVSFLIILAILVQLPQSMRPEGRSRADQKEVGLWLKQNTPPGTVIMSNSPIEAFYAEREFLLLPQGISTPRNPGRSYNEIISYAKTKGVRYILTNRNTHEMNPGFIESIQSKDLKEVFMRADRKSIIYEVIY